MSDQGRRAPSAAEDTKFSAEAAKFNAEAEKLLAEARLAVADASKRAAEADEAVERSSQERLKTKVARFQYDREAEKRARELADFKQSRIYPFEERVYDKSVAKCITELRYWHQIDPGCDIEIMFDSPGGSVFDGLNLYDYIQELKRSGHTVTTSTRGMAASMGGILLQAGHVRVMGAESWILIHEITTIVGGKIGEIEDEVELVKKIQERVLGIFASRSSLSKTALRRRWRRRDWWVDSTEAKKLGLVDEIR